ncbi:hypothetical protein HU200_053573 [Digitaria exilis]|uniref:Uncharacterized protein n=1 Tax=Digitaria exilis TaxID=1010633 RepID=A0A835AK27_9POAL|nr:hypothetical protein HU200_053573 [Digitaria exilis]
MASSSTYLTGNRDNIIALVENAASAEFQDDDQPSADEPPASPTTLSSDVNLEEVSPTTGPWVASLLAKADKLKLVNEDPSLRRSIRQKGQKNGFRHKVCLDKECIGCASHPPTISPSIIRNLGSSFCGIPQAELSDAALSKKKKVLAPMGKKKTTKKNSKDANDDPKDKEAATKKKPRK